MKQKIDRVLDSLIPTFNNPLAEPVKYSLRGGKRLRPLLVLAVMQTYNAPIEKALHSACALEFVHTYSLIHDDLPCMDNDDFRRGKPTLHKAFSEELAVLSGDYLLTSAFEIIVNDDENVSAVEKIQLLKCLSHRAGIYGMIGGQVADLEETQWNEEKISKMQKMKTGGLLTAAFEFGGILSGEKDLSLLQAIGEAFGEAYQINDDLIDEDGTMLIFGKAQMRKKLQKLLEKTQDLLEHLPKEGELLKELIEPIIVQCI